MRRWISVLALILVLVFCSFGFAEEQSAFKQIVDVVLDVLVKLIIVGVTALIGVVLKKLKDKYGIELSEKHEAMVNDYALKAIAYADEKYRKKLKENSSLVVKGEEKFNSALKWLCEKVPILTEAKAKDLIVSNLPKFRAMIENKVGT